MRTGEREVAIPVDDIGLTADLVVPAEDGAGVVLFAHGSGSSRRSPRNREVARELHRHGFATVLVDLLTAPEEQVDAKTAELRFDISLLAGRLVRIVDWLGTEPDLGALPLGLFGASTGAAAALLTAANRPARVGAVVSRGGRPDLAGPALTEVRAPTLLLVGELDEYVIRLNEEAAITLGGDVRVQVVPGATHLFTEPGALATVAGAAADWFGHRLSR